MVAYDMWRTQWLLQAALWAGPGKHQYMDATTMALLTWTPTHSALPTALYEEQKLESMIRELANSTSKDRRAIEIEEDRKLWLNVLALDKEHNITDANYSRLLSWRFVLRLHFVKATIQNSTMPLIQIGGGKKREQNSQKSQAPLYGLQPILSLQPYSLGWKPRK